jgi:hypothetical protein
VRQAVQAQLSKKHADSDFVFHRPDGPPWGNIGVSIEDLVVGAGLQKNEAPQRLTPHSLRHTFASWLAIAGVSLRRIQELLGHKSITTTERYSHLGQNGAHPYYFELAGCVVNGFVPRFVTSPSSAGMTESAQVVEQEWRRGSESNRRIRVLQSFAPREGEAIVSRVQLNA